MSKKTDPPASPLPSIIAEDIRVVFGSLKRRLRDETDIGGLPWAQVSILSRLERGGPTTTSDLARAENMTPQSMGKIVDILVKGNFVIKMADANDGRKTYLCLPDHIQRWFRKEREKRQNWLAQAIEKTLTASEQKQLANAVALLKRLSES